MSIVERNEIADRLAIYDLYARYVHAVDDRRIEDLDRYVFLPETTIDWTSAGHIKVPWQNGGREDYERNALSYDFNFHLYGNTRIDIEADGTTARAKSKVINMSVKDGEAFTVFGEYADIVIKTEKGWRFKERIWIHGTVVSGLQLADGSGGLLEK